MVDTDNTVNTANTVSGKTFAGDVAFAASQYGKENAYWLKKLSGELTKTGFLYDYPGGDVSASDEGVVSFAFSPDSVSKLTKLSKRLDHRLYMILVSGLVALLYKYTGHEDIVTGSPIFKQETEGKFINTVLVLRNRMGDNVNFKQLLLERVRPTITEACEHQNFPMEYLLFQLNIPASEGEFPFFDVALLLENIQDLSYIKHTHPKIVFSFLRTAGGIEGKVEYDTSLYHRETIQRIAGHYQRLMEQAVFNINAPISSIDLLTEEEKHRVLVEFNGTATPYPHQKTIDELFEEEVSRNPDTIAMTYEGEELTYPRLNEKAGCLALYLREQGLHTGEPVGVMVEDSPAVIIAILGILKAGGAYLPLNADYPEKRKTYILNDCNVRLFLTNFDTPGIEVPMVIRLDDGSIYSRGGSFEREHGSGDLAYIMYTSGSTGVPKGVMVEHRSVVRLVRNTNFIEFKAGDGILLTGALEFDASTFEIWGALLNGLTLHLVSKRTILSHDRLKDVIRGRGVSTMWMTSPLFNRMSDADIEIFAGLRYLLVGGDILSPVHINRVRERFPGLRVINGYGPTENTTFSTTHLIDREYRK
ncbi:MAG: AMP-binding protein, partial [bacterium]|nr:AMP-binding protein [bacterium]